PLATVEGGSAQDKVRRVAESAQLTAHLGALIAEAVTVAPSQVSPDTGITIDTDLLDVTLADRDYIEGVGVQITFTDAARTKVDRMQASAGAEEKGEVSADV
ncbi:hypothetical protein JCM3770_005836, partial [Rhodotorula araucariae]